ncbi:uncharacterized protein LOC123527112 [Mercenaria mercenaria]|uniref:uncharacterized protein LOC123527112 n=1 Tax=Mercenaria mercenaria TaxID=6596 RepID=UPI001E1E17DD|nr:uncharacterized protein LOC123527112 [Mercenaria mercenaria]
MILVRCTLILVLVQPIVGLMCYFCTDTSNEEGRNRCQTYYRTMRYYGKKALDKGSYKTDKYVKNCTDYGEPGKPKYCMIASVEERKNVRSFIRGCSDGTTFLGAEVDVQFDENLIRPDNQTTCKYTGQGYIVCITICGSEYEYGDFCNGPPIVASATTLHSPWLLLLLTLLKITLS